MAKIIFGTSPLGEVSWQWLFPEDYDEPTFIKVTVEATSLEVAMALFEFFPDWKTSLVNEEFRAKLAELSEVSDQLEDEFGDCFDNTESQPDPPIFSRTFEAGKDFVTPMKEAAEILGIQRPTLSFGEFQTWKKIRINLWRLNFQNEEVMEFLSRVRLP